MMATLEETQKQLDDAKKRVATITAQLKTPASAAVRSSLKAQLTAADKEVKRLEKAIKPLEEAAKQAVKEAESAITAANLSEEKVQIGIAQRKKLLDASSRAYQKDPANDDKWAKFQKDAQNLYDYEQSAIAAGSSITPSITLSAGTYSIGTPPATTPTGATPTVSATNIPGPTVRPGVGQRPAATTPVVTPTDVTTTPVVTPTGDADIKKPGKGKGKGKKDVAPVGVGPMGLTADVRAEFAKQFPEFASSLDGGEAEQAFVDFFGKDLIDLWVKVATTDEYDLDSDAGVGVYLRDVENTAYGQRTNEAQQTFDFSPKNQAVLIKAKRDEITKSYADLQLTESQLAEVAREAARNGYTGDDLRFTLYNFAYRGGLPTVTESALADEIRNIGRSYGYTVSEDKLKAALTGTAYNGRMVTKESLLQEAQAAAKGQFGHLADQIDSGLTLDDIFYNYRMFAAKTLGIDPNEIDYTKDPKWSAALGTKETGQMTLNDWTRMLKSDERYGWQFTDEANQTATKLVREMEKAFGFRK